MKTTHTSGPWSISKHATPDYAPQFGVWAEGASGDLATVTGEANAHLIAAAPEMLELLKDLLLRLDMEPVEAVFPCSAMRGFIRDTIAKAENR